MKSEAGLGNFFSPSVFVLKDLIIQEKGFILSLYAVRIIKSSFVKLKISNNAFGKAIIMKE